MLKRLALKYWPIALLLLLLSAVLCMSRYTEDRKEKNQDNAQARSPEVSITPSDASKSSPKANNPQHPPNWSEAFAWPEGVTAWALLLTLVVIAWQSTETRGAAQASSEQATIAKASLVSSFRPKIVLRSIVLNPRNLAAYQAADDGVWKIELLLVNTGCTQATVETCEIDFAWTNDDPRTLDRAPTHILPTIKWPTFVIPAAGRYPLEIALPYENGFSISFDLMMRMLSNPNSRGQHAWPTCRGTIVYVDENGHRRQTGFCRRWNMTNECFQIADDPDLEYQD